MYRWNLNSSFFCAGSSLLCSSPRIHPKGAFASCHADCAWGTVTWPQSLKMQEELLLEPPCQQSDPQTYQTCWLITALSPDVWHMQTGSLGWSILLNKHLWQIKINVPLTPTTFLLHIKKNSYTLEVRSHLPTSLWNILEKRRQPSIGKRLN